MDHKHKCFVLTTNRPNFNFELSSNVTYPGFRVFRRFGLKIYGFRLPLIIKYFLVKRCSFLLKMRLLMFPPIFRCPCVGVTEIQKRGRVGRSNYPGFRVSLLPTVLNISIYVPVPCIEIVHGLKVVD
jgi:hypothetical protein